MSTSRNTHQRVGPGLAKPPKPPTAEQKQAAAALVEATGWALVSSALTGDSQSPRRGRM